MTHKMDRAKAFGPSPGEGDPNRDGGLGAECAKAVEAALSNFPGEVGPEQRELIRADVELSYRCPDQYVAYVDEWANWDGSPRLRRQVVKADKDLVVVQEAVAASPNRTGLIINYSDGPAGNVEPLVWDLPEE